MSHPGLLTAAPSLVLLTVIGNAVSPVLLIQRQLLVSSSSLGIKQPKRDADHSPPPYAKIESLLSLPHLLLYCVMYHEGHSVLFTGDL
jgi:hypothetical protein